MAHRVGIVIGVVLSGCAAGAGLVGPERPGTVTGTTTIVSPHCGGVTPAPGDEQRVSHGFALDVYEGASVPARPPLATVPPGAGGAYAVKLSAGRWCLVRSGRWRQVEADTPKGAGAFCWRQLVTACDAVVDVKAGEAQEVNVGVSEPCFWNRPCFPYQGAPP